MYPQLILAQECESAYFKMLLNGGACYLCQCVVGDNVYSLELSSRLLIVLQCQANNKHRKFTIIYACHSLVGVKTNLASNSRTD